MTDEQFKAEYEAWLADGTQWDRRRLQVLLMEVATRLKYFEATRDAKASDAL